MADGLNENWNFDDPSRLLQSVGSFGATDAERYAHVLQTRTRRAVEVAERLRLTRDDVVVDLGSGLGITANRLAPFVKRLICADVSTTFLEQCRRLNREVGNVEPVQISYADLSAIPPPVDKIYSLLLFIHFNVYDLVYHLCECNRILRRGGLLYFDFHDGARIRLDASGGPEGGISRHLALYKEHRCHWVFQSMQVTSIDVLNNLFAQTGFVPHRFVHSGGSFCQALVEKVSDCPDYVPRARA